MLCFFLSVHVNTTVVSLVVVRKFFLNEIVKLSECVSTIAFHLKVHARRQRVGDRERDRGRGTETERERERRESETKEGRVHGETKEEYKGSNNDRVASGTLSFLFLRRILFLSA